MLTIDQAIEQLQKAKMESNLKGDTVLCVCIPEIEYVAATEIKIENDETGGAVCLIMNDYQEYKD